MISVTFFVWKKGQTTPIFLFTYSYFPRFKAPPSIIILPHPPNIQLYVFQNTMSITSCAVPETGKIASGDEFRLRIRQMVSFDKEYTLDDGISKVILKGLQVCLQILCITVITLTCIYFRTGQVTTIRN